MNVNLTIEEQIAAQNFAARSGGRQHWTLVAGDHVVVASQQGAYIARCGDYDGAYDDGAAQGADYIAYRSLRGAGGKCCALLRQRASGQLSDAAIKLAAFKRGRNPFKAKRTAKPRVKLSFERRDMVSGREYIAVHGKVLFVIADWRERDWLSGELVRGDEAMGSFCCFILDARLLRVDGFCLTEPNEVRNYSSWTAALRFIEEQAVHGDALLSSYDVEYADQLIEENGLKS